MCMFDGGDEHVQGVVGERSPGAGTEVVARSIGRRVALAGRQLGALGTPLFRQPAAAAVPAALTKLGPCAARSTKQRP